MKIILTLSSENEQLYITSYGFEDISQNARWGKGSRDTFIIHYVLEGEGVFNGNPVKKGEGFVITPKTSHKYYSSKSNPWKYFWLTFNGTSARDICKKYIFCNELNIFKFDFMGKLLNLCESIFSEDGAITETKALSYFFTLLSFHDKKIGSAGNRYVAAAKNYMNIHFCRNITITEIASAIGIDDRYLYNLFIRHEKVSPKNYLSDLRLGKAKALLVNTDLSISEIAVSSGFPDVLYFSRYFSKKMNISPSMYRKSVTVKEEKNLDGKTLLQK